MSIGELRFSSEEEALQYFADVTGEKVLIAADKYEEKAHPAVKNFWKDLPKNKEHVYGKHPNLVLEGDKLSKESFEHTDKLVEKHDVKHQELGNVFYEIEQREAKHKGALERLAVKAVSKMFHVPEDEFEAHLSKEVDVNPVSEVPEAAAKHSKLTPKLVDEINKRITSNAFAQGASVHAFLTAHFFDQIEEEIKKIDPELVKLYSKFASGSHHLYWLMNMAEMNFGSAAIGSMKPEYDPNTKQMKIVARSPMFVVLVQELAKGAMELRYLKHLQERNVEDLSDEDMAQ